MGNKKCRIYFKAIVPSPRIKGHICCYTIVELYWNYYLPLVWFDNKINPIVIFGTAATYSRKNKIKENVLFHMCTIKCYKDISIVRSKFNVSLSG
ncbi:hypothetical protein AGMMS50239_35890 [Bacteroidia bacterium]|nr:hypothetical protein AGMMS50239_35890 [Bacteroidia bacterium]